MRKIREVLRLKYECGLGHRAISASVGISKGWVSEYVQRAERVGLRWEDARELSEAEVERRLFRYAGSHEPSERRSTSPGCTASCAAWGRPCSLLR